MAWFALAVLLRKAEEQRIDPDKKPLKVNPSTKGEEFSRIRVDTLVGMAFSNIIAIAIIITTAATLHAHGKTNIETSAQAAEEDRWQEASQSLSSRSE